MHINRMKNYSKYISRYDTRNKHTQKRNNEEKTTIQSVFFVFAVVVIVAVDDIVTPIYIYIIISIAFIFVDLSDLMTLQMFSSMFTK